MLANACAEKIIRKNILSIQVDNVTLSIEYIEHTLRNIIFLKNSKNSKSPRMTRGIYFWCTQVNRSRHTHFWADTKVQCCFDSSCTRTYLFIYYLIFNIYSINLYTY